MPVYSVSVPPYSVYLLPNYTFHLDYLHQRVCDDVRVLDDAWSLLLVNLRPGGSWIFGDSRLSMSRTMGELVAGKIMWQSCYMSRAVFCNLIGAAYFQEAVCTRECSRAVFPLL